MIRKQDNRDVETPEKVPENLLNEEKERNEYWTRIQNFRREHKRVIYNVFLVSFNILAVIYFIFASVFEYNRDDNCIASECRGQFCRGYGTLLLIYVIFYGCLFYCYLFKPIIAGFLVKVWKKVMKKHGKWIKIVFLGVFISTKVIILIYMLVVEISEDYTRLQSLLGIVFVVVCGVLFSHNRSKVNWNAVGRGLFLQGLFGMVVLKKEFIRNIFYCVAQRLLAFRLLSLNGSRFVFGEFLQAEQVFAFYALTSVFFISFTVAILYYLGWAQNLISKIGQVCKHLNLTTYIESTFATSRLFFGVMESFLCIKPFLSRLTKSELHAVLTSAFASAAGSTLSIYTSLGAQPIHLITANIMSAPASLALSKLIYPETEETRVRGNDIKSYKEESESILDAGTKGAADAIKIYLHVIANVIAFVAFITFLNGVVEFATTLVGLENISIEYFFELIFTPICWLIGIPWKDCGHVGEVIGLKLVDNELMAYEKLMELLQNDTISPRSAAIATFVLSSFANPTAVAIIVGGFIALVPENRQMMVKLLISAFVTGVATSLMTASVAGFLMKADMYEFSRNLSTDNINGTRFNLHYL